MALAWVTTVLNLVEGIANHVVAVGAAGSVTIREKNGVENLAVGTATKLGQHPVQGGECFVQWRATEIQPCGRTYCMGFELTIGLSSSVGITLCECDAVQNTAGVDELTLVRGGGQEVDHHHVAHLADVCVLVRSRQDVRSVPEVDWLGRGICVVPVRVHLVGAIAECVQFEWNVGFAAEHGKSDRLLDSGFEVLVHGTGPVHDDDEPVVLAIGDDLVLGEDVFGPPVVDHLDGVKAAALLNAGTTMLVCCLSHLELLDEVVHGGLLTTHELVTLGECSGGSVHHHLA